MSETKPDICVDFDGVIHSYTSGWQGADVISDPPVAGAFDWLADAVEHFTVHIYSSRSKEDKGRAAMYKWFFDQGLDLNVLEQLKFSVTKPAAQMTIDDRAYCFEGEFPDVEWIKTFQPWYKR